MDGTIKAENFTELIFSKLIGKKPASTSPYFEPIVAIFVFATIFVLLNYLLCVHLSFDNY